MIPHFALLLTVSLLALVAQTRRMPDAMRILLWLSVFTALTLFGGLRGNYVGADTIVYVSWFEDLGSLNMIWDSFGSSEFGIKSLYALGLLIGKDPTIILLITSAFASFFFIMGITRISKDPALSVFVLIAFGFFAFHLNGMRQGLALAVYMLAIPSLLSGSFIRYAAWVGLATLFHATAIFTLPMYFLFRQKFSLWILAAVFVIATGFVVFLDTAVQVAGLANERYATYADRTETGGALLTLFHVLLSVLFVLSRPIVRRDWRDNYDRLLTMMVFGSMILAVVTLSGSYVEMGRMAIYFTIAMIFLWPLLLLSIQDAKIRTAMTAGLLLSGTVFLAIFLNQIGGYIPYVLR